MTNESIQQFFEKRVPKEWFTGAASIESDEEEILVVGALAPSTAVGSFREETRVARMAIADEAASTFRRTVSWGVECDGVTTLFTTVSTPVMTRLRLRERKVLDTLIDGGVARSRSEALGWCVKLVGQHQAAWLAELREAIADVEHVRADGPVLL